MMTRFPIIRNFFFFLSAFLSQVSPVSAQVSSEESLQSIEAAEGFAVQLWGGEPLVSNPTGMDVDSQGRVWVTEGLNYRLWARAQKGMERAEGADRIKILSDTDGDGKADQVKIFADNIYPSPLGLAVEEIWIDGRYEGARVYVGKSPDILVLEDIDGDDKADLRYPLLSGFRGTDSDHGVHGMMLGPDGKLYFTVGDARYGSDQLKTGDSSFDVTDRSGRRLQGTEMGSTLRVNLDGTELEALGYRQRNNYGTFADSFGHVFTSDNDDDGQRGCRMIWLMDGGNYGYKWPGSNLHSAEELPGIIPKIVGTGNGAPGGLLVYEGDLFPEEYHGAVIQPDAGTHQINFFPLERYGAAFRSEYRILARSDDSWFRPVEAAVAPDGSLFICDWYDGASGGNRFSDRSTGRIFRITYPGRENLVKSAPNDFKTDSGLVDALRSPNVATRIVARKELISHGAQSRNSLLELFQTGRPHERARALFVLADLPETRELDLREALTDKDARIREQALRILARDLSDVLLDYSTNRDATVPPAVRVLDDILPMAKDTDAGVRRELIQALRNVETSKAGPGLLALAESWDGRDRYYLEALRAALRKRESWFINQLFDQLIEQWVDDLNGKKSSIAASNQPMALPPFYPITTNDAFLRIDDELPPATIGSKIIGLAWSLGREEALPSLRILLKKGANAQLARGVDLALNQIDSPQGAELLVEQFFNREDTQGRREILIKLGERIAGPWQSVLQESRIHSVFDEALESKALRTTAISAIARSGASGYSGRFLKLIYEEREDLSVRIAAVEALGQLRYQPLLPLLEQLIGEAREKTRGGPLALAALSALSRFPEQDQSPSLDTIAADLRYPLDFRRRAAQTLSSSSSGAYRLLKMQQSKRLPDDLFKEIASLLNNHPDKAVRQQARSEMPLPDVGGTLTMEAMNAAITLQSNPARGREVYFRPNACGICHRVQGVGNLVGPDLSTIGTKYDKRELLYHTINPSGTISYDYVSDMLILTDGSVRTGLIINETSTEVVIKTAQGDRISIPAHEVKSKQAQNVSLMPEGLVATMSKQELADLLEYLSTLNRPVSEVGQYYVLGPLEKGAFDETVAPDLGRNYSGIGGRDTHWRLLSTDRENRLDLTSLLGTAPGMEVVVYVPVVSDRSQDARIVVQSPGEIGLWQKGHSIELKPLNSGGFMGLREAVVKLEPGENKLLIRLQSGQVKSSIITTLISKHPLRFNIQ